MDKRVITIILEIDQEKYDPERIAKFVWTIKATARMMSDFTSGSFHVPCLCTGICGHPAGAKLEFNKAATVVLGNPNQN